jgi:hypothetical protein
MARSKIPGRLQGTPRKLPLPSIRARPMIVKSKCKTKTNQLKNLPQVAEPRINLESAVKYLLALLGMVAPSLQRPMAAHNVAAMQLQHYHDILLPNIQDVQELLSHRESKRT